MAHEKARLAAQHQALALLLAVIGGGYLAHRQWRGRYRVSYFAGLCPRCGQAVSLGVDRCISLPHTLTCFSCHFEPRLEVRFVDDHSEPEEGSMPEHRDANCVGCWEVRWLADEPLLVCSRCRASCPSTSEAREAAREENDRAALLEQLTREGRSATIREFLNRLNHLRLQKNFSSSKEMLTSQGPAQNVGGISAELS